MELTLMEKAVKSLKHIQIENEKRKKEGEIQEKNKANKNNNQAKEDGQKSGGSANKAKLMVDNKEDEKMEIKVGESNQV